MDLLNRACLQLYERFRSMTPGSRLTAGLSAAVVLASLGYFVTHQASSPEVDLMHGAAITASQLQKMEASLGNANLTGYEVRGMSIFVPRGQESVFMAALAKDKALPPNFSTAQHEAVSGGSWMELGSQRERERSKIAKQETLAMAIEKMPGIESAYVIYDVDNSPGAFREKLITASALVSGKIDEAMVSAIRQMVAGAIAGLKPENVTVSDLTSSKSYGNSTAAGNADDNLYVCLKRTYEQDLTAKILNALTFIPNATVALSVELDRERILRVKQLPDAATGHSRDNKAPQMAPQAGPMPLSSQRSNVATILDNLLGGPPHTDAATEPKNESPGVRAPAERETAGPMPISARVSVGVPASYFKKIWQDRNPSQSGAAVRTPDASALNQICAEETVKIQRHVAPLLPTINGVAGAADLVTVTPFQDTDVSVAAAPPPAFQQVALKWLGQSWDTLSMIGLALVGLLVLRSMVRSAPTAVESAKSDVGAVNVDEEPAEARRANRRQRFDAASPSFREELSAIVEDDPETAANVLRNWIGQGV